MEKCPEDEDDQVLRALLLLGYRGEGGAAPCG
jgi:hypothetical protein